MGETTVLTAARMKLIEAMAVVSGMVSGDNLILTRNDGTEIDAGVVRGPKGDQGEPGSIEVAPAGGDLEGYYPNPTIKPGAVSSTPTGAFMATLRTTEPDGWLFMNGQEVSRSTYADLFAEIGTIGGPGDGTTTFNVPNVEDLFVVGASGTKSLGSLGGSDTQTLLEENLPPHDHSIDHDHAAFNTASGGAHKHFYATIQSNSDGIVNNSKRDGSGTGTAIDNSGPHIHEINVPAYTGTSGSGDGVSEPFDIVPSYIAANYIIKT